MSGLNESQQRRLRVTCQYIDRLLGEIETILNASASGAAFPQYVPDIGPAGRRTIEDYISRMRAQLRRVLEGQGIGAPAPHVPAARAVRANLTAIDIAAEELKPSYMAGFGEMSAEIAVELNGIAGELRGLVARLDRYVAQGAAPDLRARLEQLEHSGTGAGLLARIEDVVTRRGLVEFRPPIVNLLDRMTDNALEVAVFGRVSSGKSSLLNALLGTDVLPVGVTPVTSVLTRLSHGNPAQVTVYFAERPAQECAIERLREFVTEQENPGNRKNVARVCVSVPSARLDAGVVFVDTPGLGSLATSGAAETLAYLPQCDFGMVLIDAASPLTPDDIHTIQLLAEAAIPQCVLLSKCDLLSPADLASVCAYAQEQLARAGHAEIRVVPVSVLGAHRTSLDAWFEGTILPLFAKSREMREASMRRKAGLLRESVVAALHAQLRPAQGASTQVQAVEARLRAATGRIAGLQPWCERECRRILTEREAAFRAAATRVFEAARQDLSAGLARDALLEFVRERTVSLHERLLGFAREIAAELQSAALSLGMADAPAAAEFEAPLRESPVFEFTQFEFRAGRSSLAGLGGRSLVERRIAGRLERAVGERWTSALVCYSSLLNHWCAGVIKQWNARFESYAEGYRAQAQRAAGGAALGEDDALSLAQDISALGAWEPAMDGSATATAPNRQSGLE